MATVWPTPGVVRRMTSRAALALAMVVVLGASACSSQARITDVTHSVTPTATPASHAPLVDPTYIYDQLASMSGRFLHREAGFDTGLPPSQNGHDEFAAYWAQELTHSLDGFGPRTTMDSFSFTGWRGRPAQTPAVNVEVSVPGVIHPEQVVVIACHYDAEAWSTQSAFDDASGCAIALGVAKALGESWRQAHVWPARTLRFIAFDAEESGIFGSYHYLNTTANGDIGNIVAMFNEEQNGIGYPLRFEGKMAYPFIPFEINMSPLGANTLYPNPVRMTQAQAASNARFQALLAQANPAVFAEFRALGLGSLSYRDASGQATAQPVFTDDQLGNAVLRDDTTGGSDELVFTEAGLPCVTYSGNSTYYYRDQPQPAWSYPYDQPQDTLALMNIYASGHTVKSPALVLALALPAMHTAWMLFQPDVLGQATLSGSPVVALGDVGQTVAGKPVVLDASGSYDPVSPGDAITVSWDFGDGLRASKLSVSHIYGASGTYVVTVTVQSAHGTAQLKKTVHVVTAAPFFPNPRNSYPGSGYPAPNPNVIIPQAEG
ncbi:MAG TPA: M28 family peptidase [Ktedonobacterales bacterium]